MSKHIPYEKLSKKEKRKLDSLGRNTWGTLNPVTRKPENSRAYNRKKAQSWKKEFPNSVPFHFRESHFCLIYQCLYIAVRYEKRKNQRELTQ